MAWGKGRWPYLVRTRRAKTVAAFTLTDEFGFRPADFVVGVLVKRHSPFGGFQYFVGDQFADGNTIEEISNPTRELIRKLEAKRRAWSQENSAIEAAREELDNSFRIKQPHPRDQISYVRKDREKAFGKFCDDNMVEDARLTTERRAVVAKLVERYAKQTRDARAAKGRVTVSKSASSAEQKADAGRKRKANSKKPSKPKT